MAFTKSPTAKAARSVVTPAHAGETITVSEIVDLAAGFVAAADTIDALVIPAYSTLTSLEVIGVGMPATCTASVGYLNGAVYGKDDRTIPTNLATGLNVATTTATKAATAALVGAAAAVSDTDRALGIKLSHDVPAGAAKLRVVATYAVLP